MLRPPPQSGVGTPLAAQPLRLSVYMPDAFVAVSSSVIAFVTTVHAALLVIHVQRARGVWRPIVALPAAAFGALAWVLATPGWLAAGLLTHAAWAIVVLKLSPPANPSPPRNETPPGPGTRPGMTTAPSFVPARVLAVVDETDAIRTFRIARPPRFDFEPGQFLMVKVDVAGAPVARCYSISSPPGASGFLEISVKRQGVVSDALHQTVRPGATLLIHPPLGRFTAPPGDDDLVLIAGGIGITPLISILRHTVHTQPARRITLLYSVRAPGDAAFATELAWLQQRHPQVRTVMTVTGGQTGGDWRQGRVDRGLVLSAVADVSHSVFLICGPLAMIDGVREVLSALGVAPSRIRFEAFEAAVAVASQGLALEGAAGRLRLTVSGGETELRPAETLLDGAERAGGRISSFCRAGICGTCRTRLVSGDVRCTGEALSTEERQQGYVLPCVSWAGSDCALEA